MRSLSLLRPTLASAREVRYRGLDLEYAAGRASLVLVARVVDVERTTKLILGARPSCTLILFQFESLQVLPGVFSCDTSLRPAMSLAAIGTGVTRGRSSPGRYGLLVEGRSSQGCTKFRFRPLLRGSIIDCYGRQMKG